MSHPPITSFSGSYRFLSNFYRVPSGFLYEGVRYTTVEHAFQSAKTLDPTWKKKIQCAPTPDRAKALGKRCPLRPDWEAVKIPIMRELLFLKFRADFLLRCSLISTGDALLIEGNYWGDRTWGVCDGQGENHLGKLLMQVRAELQTIAMDNTPIMEG